MKLAGNPFALSAIVTWSFSFVHSAAVDDSALARDSRLHFITEQKLQPGETLVSFDVVLLFTNVPMELAINVACRRLLEDDTLEDRTLLTVDQIITLF